MKNAGAIIRVSSVGQLSNTSPETQIEAILKQADNDNYSIDIEKHKWLFAESGKIADRQGFEQAKKAVAKKEISRIYVYSVSRLGRNLLTMLQFLEEMAENEIEIYCIEDNGVIDRKNISFLIKALMAQYEGDMITGRTYTGLKRTVRSGKYSGGIIAYGYQLNPATKEIEINEQEAEVIRLIYHLCVDEKMSCVKIAEYLNDRGYQTKYQLMPKGKRKITKGIWRYGRVRNMIANPAYRGVWTWGKRSKKKDNEEINSTCPAIVSEDTWNKAQGVLKSNQIFINREVKRFYLLRSLIKCRECGRTFCGYYSNVANGKENKYYRCNGKTQARGGETPCNSPTIKAEYLEDAVWEKVRDYVIHPETARRFFCQQLEETDNNVYKNEIIEIDKTLKDYDLQLDNLLLVATKTKNINFEKLDELAADINTKKENLIHRKSNIISSIEQTSKIKNEYDNFENFLLEYQDQIDSLTFEQKRILVTGLVDHIEVGNNIPTIEIFYKFQEITQNSVIVNCNGKGAVNNNILSSLVLYV